MRDIVSRFDFCSFLLVLIVTLVLAQKAGRMLPRFAKAMWWTGTGVLLAIAGTAYSELQPRKADEIIAILGVAAIAGCATALVTAMTLTPMAAIGDWLYRQFDHWRSERLQKDLERRRADDERRLSERREQEQINRQKAEEEIRRAQPRPPSREERADAARQRHEQTMRMIESAQLDGAELEAARERAKQKYLQELDGLMK